MTRIYVNGNTDKPAYSPSKNTGILVVEMLVTPSQAQTWLTDKGDNRPLNKKHIEYLANEIAAGRWKVTHQGIAFDQNGKLVDGQHRLSAIVASNTPCRMMVATGVQREDALAAVDQGKYRTRGQRFAMFGEKYGELKAATCRIINVLTTPTLGYTGTLGASADDATLHYYRDEIEYLCARDPKSIKISSAYCGATALFLRAMPELAQAWHQGVLTGANLSEDDPRLLLRNFLMRPTKLGGSASSLKILKVCCAIDAYINDETLGKLTPSAARYARYCEKVNIPVNTSLYAYAKSTKR